FVRGVGASIADYDAIAERIRSVPGVVSVMPLVDGQVMVQSPQNASGALVRGLREQDLKNLAVVADNISVGSLDGFDEGGVAIGSRLAQNMGLTVGDSITLLSPRGAITPFGTAPRVASFPIRAIFEIG